MDEGVCVGGVGVAVGWVVRRELAWRWWLVAQPLERDARTGIYGRWLGEGALEGWRKGSIRKED